MVLFLILRRESSMDLATPAGVEAVMAGASPSAAKGKASERKEDRWVSWDGFLSSALAARE